MDDHTFVCPDCGSTYVCDGDEQDPPCCNRETLRAENERLRTAMTQCREWLERETEPDRAGIVAFINIALSDPLSRNGADSKSSPDIPSQSGDGIAAAAKASIDTIIRDLCELPDDVDPEQDGALTVTVEELRIILTRHLDPEHA